MEGTVIATPEPEPEKVNPKTGEIVPAEQVPTMPAIRPEDVPREQLYHGMGMHKFTKEQNDILLAPADPRLVLKREDGLVYIPWIHFARRLNRAFGPGGWGLEPRGNGLMRGSVWWKGALIIDGKVLREATGDTKWQPTNARMTYASAVESARSDCLVKCCKDLGIMLELWDKQWIEWWEKGSWKESPPVPAGNNSDRISPAQMKAIHGYASKKGYDHDALHNYCLSEWNCGLSGLTVKQASDLIERIQQWQ